MSFKQLKKERQPQEKMPLKDRLIKDAKTWGKDFSLKQIGTLYVWSLVVNLIIEILGQFKYGGFFEAFRTIGHSPFVFLYNALIIMVTISFCLIFKRSYFWMVLLSMIWLGLGVANSVILSYRVTPFSAVELKLVDAAMGVMKSYVSMGMTILVIGAIVVAVGLIFVLWKKAPVKKTVNYVSAVITIAGLIVILELATQAGLKTKVIATTLPNLSESYVDYGFVYCFSNSLVNTGISKPKDYSAEKVTEIKDSVNEKLSIASGSSVTTGDSVTPYATTVVDATPNIIFLQLESFFDITEVEKLQLSEDPIPFFRSCLQNFSSGYLSVPVVGAGTANTEFEIITGMDLDFFGPGEYPYKTVLKNRTCETICNDLKLHGYTTQAMHNNRASFYGRNKVFSQFGFDIFTSMELMNIQEYTENGWAKDKILTSELLKALQGTDTQDFIYTISVQGHGGYPTEPSTQQQQIQVLAGIDSEDEKNAVQYYTNQIYEMDQFLKDLTNELWRLKQETGEDTVVVAYGDHLPSLGFNEEDLKNKNMYQTQYIVWNTMDLSVEHEDLEAYQLSSRIMGRFGISDGEINAYHQANRNTTDEEKYLEDLKVLGYDMFYGDHYSSDGKDVYQATNIRYGVKNVEITGVNRDQSDTDYLIIRGNEFTNYSSVYINDEKIESELLDGNTIRVNLEKVTDSINICVKQSYKGKLILQTSNVVVYAAQQDENLPDNSDEEFPQQTDQTPVPTEDIDFAGLIDEEASDTQVK